MKFRNIKNNLKINKQQGNFNNRIYQLNFKKTIRSGVGMFSG